MSVGRIPNPEGSGRDFASFPGCWGWWNPGWWGWWNPGWWGWIILGNVGDASQREIGERMVQQAEELVKQAEFLRRMGEGMAKEE